MAVCNICKCELENDFKLGQHIRFFHKITKREYLDKTEGFHKCPYCDNERKWHRTFYLKTCGSNECAHKALEAEATSKYGTDYRSKKLKEVWKDETLLKKHSELAKARLSTLTQDELKSRMDKIREVCNEKYGDKNYASMRAKEAYKEKTGYDNPRKNPKVIENIQLKHREEYIVPRWNELFSEKTHKVRLSYNVYRCCTCGDVFIGDFCERCDENTYSTRSNIELEVIKEIKEFYNGDIEVNKRNIIPPKEIDIYLPEFKIGIELDGVWFHKDDKQRALLKTEACESLGIRLIHIYDVEWCIKKDILIDKIKSLMGLNKRIFARKCEIRNINNEVYSKFCEEYHIQGTVGAKWKCGLYSNNELVAIASFGKSRFADEYELLRYCSKAGISVIGGMKKLVAHFKAETGITNLVSYADRRFTSKIANVYGNENVISVSAPGYYYIKNKKIMSRFEFQKHKLKTNEFTAKYYDDRLTETEICKLAGLIKIYDCGQLKFKL